VNVEWFPKALEDRRAAISYIRQFNPEAARRLLGEFIRASRSLADFPEIGRTGRIPGTREIVVVPTYIMIYEVDRDAGTVKILRIWHTAQNR
jgi:addiction module RelE/StbE family toxin